MVIVMKSPRVYGRWRYINYIQVKLVVVIKLTADSSSVCHGINSAGVQCIICVTYEVFVNYTYHQSQGTKTILR